MSTPSNVPPPAARSSSPSATTEQEDGEKPGLFQSHGWLTPVVVIVSIVVLFAAMFALTWGAGGGEVFGS